MSPLHSSLEQTGSLHRRGRAGVALLLAIALVGCAHGPQWDREVGEKASREMAVYMGLVEDPKLDAYVAATGQQLVARLNNRRFTYSFHVVDQEVPNAFSLPGGYVYVSRGALALSNSQDELASVLGHEIGHVEARHAAKRMEAATVPGLIALPGTVVGGAVGPIIDPRLGDIIAAPAALGGAAYLAGYSREQERDADRLGQQLAAGAGFDAGAMAHFLQSLGQSETLSSADAGGAHIPDFLQTHPQTPERVAAAEHRAAELGSTGAPRHDPAEHLRMLDGLIVGENPAAGVFVNDLFVQPKLAFSVAAPGGWEKINTPMAVAAVAPQRDALMLLAGIPGASSPSSELAKFVAEIRRQRLPYQAVEAFELNGLPASSVALSQQSRGQQMHLGVVWVAHRGTTYRIVGVGSSERLGALRAAMESFHDMTPAERDSVTVTRLRLIPAKEGESLADLTRRTGNKWDVKMTGVANAIEDPSATLRAGLVVKVAVAEKYVGE